MFPTGPRSLLSSARMGRVLRDGSGALLVVVAMTTLGAGIVGLHEHDYVTAVVLILTGLSLLGAAVELLRPSVGE